MKVLLRTLIASSNIEPAGSAAGIKMASFALGQEVSNGERVDVAPPWMVALNQDNGLSFCTGTLVSRTAVLTAAHCRTPDHVRIGSTRSLRDGIRRNIESRENAPMGDAALLFLESPVPASYELATVSIDPAHTAQGADVIYMGFGRDEDRQRGRLIRTLAGGFSVNNNGDNRRCDQLPWICFDQLGVSRVETGDSGGPWLREDDDGWQVVAVHDGENDPEVATRTTELADWLGDRVTQYAGPECGGLLATIVGDGGPITGTPNDDVIVGTNAAETISGGGGNDVICGLGGHDTIYGQDGNDTLYGGPGNDTIQGGNGNDNLQGVSGNDALYGQAGNDNMYGQAGNDWMRGGDGADEMYGSSGRDTMYGDNDDDLIYGGPGDDKIHGGNGNDNLQGVGGKDWLYGNNGDDLLYGQVGDDLLYGHAGNDTLYGSTGNDWLFGGDGDDSLQAAGGNDWLYGENGADTLYGQAGNDFLSGGADVDQCFPGAGSDRPTTGCP